MRSYTLRRKAYTQTQQLDWIEIWRDDFICIQQKEKFEAMRLNKKEEKWMKPPWPHATNSEEESGSIRGWSYETLNKELNSN